MPAASAARDPEAGVDGPRPDGDVMGRAERDCHLDGHLNGGARPRNSTWSASNDPISQKEQEVEDAEEEAEEGREHVDAVLQELKMLEKGSVSSKNEDDEAGRGAHSARRHWRWLKANSADHKQREEAPSSAPGWSHFVEPEFQRVTPVTRALWQRYTHPDRQSIERSKGELPTVTSLAASHDTDGSCTVSANLWRRIGKAFPVVRPDNRLLILQANVVMCWDATYTAFFIPVTSAFDVALQTWSWLVITDTVGLFVFTVDMWTRFNSGLVISNNLRKAVVLDRMLIAEQYLFRGPFIFDILTVVPLCIQFVVVAFLPRGHRHLGLLKVINLMRCFRLLRLFSIVRSVFGRSHMRRYLAEYVSHTVLYFISLAYTAAVCVNLFGCVFYFTARVEGITNGNTWLSAVGEQDLSFAGQPRQYLASIYWATTTIATVGYGDVTPKTAAEEGVAIGVMVLGVLLFGYVIGAVTDLIRTAGLEAEQGAAFRQKMKGVERWMELRGLPRHIRAEIVSYYSEVWTQHQAVQDAEFFDDLPAWLRGQVARFRIRHVYAQSSLHGILDARSLLRLSASVTPLAVQSGHDICQQGDEADCFWFLTEGSVLALNHHTDMMRITAPAVLGEAALLRNILPAAAKRPFTMRAISSCALWIFKVSDVYRMSAMQPSLVANIHCTFLKRMEDALRALPTEMCLQLFPRAQSPDEVCNRLREELQTPEQSRSVAADVLMNMDLDFEALGGKRLIPLPSLKNLESQLKEDITHNAESTDEHSMAGMALHRLGQGVRSALHARSSMHVSSQAGGNPLSRVTGGAQPRGSQHGATVRDIHHDAVLDEVKATET